jgi:hypothetical protein
MVIGGIATLSRGAKAPTTAEAACERYGVSDTRIYV